MSQLISGHIRRSIGSSRRHLDGRLQRSRTLIDAALPTTADACDDDFDACSECISLLNASIASIQKADADWSALIINAEEQAVVASEQAQYDITACDDTGYLAALEVANDTLSRLNTRQRKVERVKNRLALSTSTNPAPGDAVRSNSSRSLTIKPPKLTLQHFTGDFRKWKEFWAIYSVNIHDRPEYTDTEKFSYLLQSLEGDAKQAIDGIMIDSSGYSTAISLLKERFDLQNERLVSMLYSEFKQLPRCSDVQKDKRRTYDTCERIFRQLESATEDVNSNKAMSFDLLSKFPQNLLRDLMRHYDVGPETPLRNVRVALNKAITDTESMQGLLHDLDAFSVKPESRQKQAGASASGLPSIPPELSAEAHRSLNSSLVATASSPFSGSLPAKPPVSDCYFCQGKHLNQHCTRYSSASSRVSRLRELGRCTRCAYLHPPGSRCQRNIRCFHCKKDSHISFLCYQTYPDMKSGSVPPVSASTSSLASKSRGSSIVHSVLESVNEAPNSVLTSMSNNSSHALFQTATVEAVNVSNGKRSFVRLALDSLSNRSYITDRIAASLGLHSDQEDRLRISVFGSQKAIEVPTRLVQVSILQRDGSLRTIEANTTKLISNSSVLPTSFPPQESQLLRSMLPSLADDPFSPGGIDILIGADFAWDFITGAKITTASSISFIPTTLGLMLAGRLPSELVGTPDAGPALFCLADRSSEIGLAAHAQVSKLETNYPDIDEYWNLERIGISDCPVQSDDDIAQKIFDESVVFENGRYQVAWPWDDEKKNLLPTNYDLALRRFRSLARRLENEPNLLQAYTEVIQTQVDRGIIERVPDAELATLYPEHYLPHHPVVKESSNTTKVRIVYDASSKTRKDDLTLNDCLLRGPVVLPDLCMLLIRFRTHEIAIIADIEKAYLQVGLQQSERDVTRFFWFCDPSRPREVDGNLAVYRFLRVAFGIISSAFLLAATCLHHLRLANTHIASQVASDQYSDNVTTGVSNLSSALEFCAEARAVYAKAGMNLHEFCSNSVELMDSLSNDDKVANPDTKVLGLRWDSLSDDSLRLQNPSPVWAASVAAPTKRSILRSVASVFDPLGFFQPVLFAAKLLLQQIWCLEYSWDEAVPDEIANDWRRLADDIEPIFTARLPRFVGHLDDNARLLVFSDASAKGYGAAAYIRFAMPDGSFRCRLIYAKSRLSPIDGKKRIITLPRLELLGTVVASQVASFCRKALQNPCLPVHLFTDSECVLSWLKSDSNLRRFVARRIETLRSLSNSNFHYVHTSENPADCVTRGKTGTELLRFELWWRGPSWASQDEVAWPVTNVSPVSHEALSEIVPRQAQAICHAVDDVLASSEGGLFGLNPDQFSSLTRLMRTTCRVFMFIKRSLWNRLSDHTKYKFPCLNFFSHMSSDNVVRAADMEIALSAWIKSVQRLSYPEVLQCLSNGRTHSLIAQLGLRLDANGLLISISRFENADLDLAAKCPTLLPKDHTLTRLVIDAVHRKNKHAGVSHTLSQLRQQFWVPQGRQCVKKVLKQCNFCRVFKTAKPFALPDMPSWPIERVRRSIPFEFCGIDYFGPINVRANGEVRKMWACLFTCLTTRAVHLEPVLDCTTPEFLLCFIRFVSRRGVPRQIFSDNAAQFHLTHILADKAWSREPVDENMLSYLATTGIRWSFIPELAPWQGGHYERLVGIVKSVLKGAIGRRLLSWSDLVTLLTEAEAVVNSRPITYVSDDRDSQSRVLRPVDFLTGQPTGLPSTSDFPATGLSDAAKRLAGIWKQRQRHLEKLWQTWYDEYLLSLRERAKNRHRAHRGAVERGPKVGEIVLLREDGLPRGSWRLARIVRLIKSKDNAIRAAEIKMQNGSLIRRAISFLIPLELDTVVADDLSDLPVASVSSNSLPSRDDDDFEFEGFSDQDIWRTANALNQFDELDEE